jgi:hypothetical protein
MPPKQKGKSTSSTMPSPAKAPLTNAAIEIAPTTNDNNAVIDNNAVNENTAMNDNAAHTTSEEDDDVDVIDDDEQGDAQHEPDIDTTNIEPQAQPVPTAELLAQMLRQITELKAQMASNAEQVTGVQQQLAAQNLLPRRGRAYAMRPWMNDDKIRDLPSVSTAPILVLNGPKDQVSVRWTKHRNELMDKWAQTGMYDPLMTWGTCATNDDKIQMVCHVHCVRHFTDMSNVCVCACGVRVCVCNAVHRSKP